MPISRTTTDLHDAESPEDVAVILRRAADRFHESRSELQSAWQDKNAGRAWTRLAKLLERTAERAEQIARNAE